MPLPIPVKPSASAPKIRGVVREIKVREGNFGQQILLTLEEPDSASYRIMTFPLSDRPNSKWMSFIESLNRCLPKPIEDASELLDLELEIEVKPRTLQTADGVREVEYPQVVAVRSEWKLDPELRILIESIWQEAGGDEAAFKARLAELGYTERQAELALGSILSGGDTDAPF